MGVRTRRGDTGPRRRIFNTRNKNMSDLVRRCQTGAQRTRDFPHTIVFDWNGTIDARNCGVGIPIDALLKLKELGKNIFIYTSSVQAPRKEFMRKVCAQYGIQTTDDEKILKYADMFVADKRSDERRAGRYGVTFVYTPDFDFLKTIEKGGETTKCKTCGQKIDECGC